jgi:hypothetical protein
VTSLEYTQDQNDYWPILKVASTPSSISELLGSDSLHSLLNNSRMTKDCTLSELIPTPYVHWVRPCRCEAVHGLQPANPNELEHPLTVAFCLDHAHATINGTACIAMSAR